MKTYIIGNIVKDRGILRWQYTMIEAEDVGEASTNREQGLPPDVVAQVIWERAHPPVILEAEGQAE